MKYYATLIIDGKAVVNGPFSRPGLAHDHLLAMVRDNPDGLEPEVLARPDSWKPEDEAKE